MPCPCSWRFVWDISTHPCVSHVSQTRTVGAEGCWLESSALLAGEHQGNPLCLERSLSQMQTLSQGEGPCRWEKVKLRLLLQVVPWLDALQRGSSSWDFVLCSSKRSIPELGCTGLQAQPHPVTPGISILNQLEAAEGQLWTSPSSAGLMPPKPAGAEGVSNEMTCIPALASSTRRRA